MPLKNSNTIYNLKNEWHHFSRKNDITQIEASRQMGWSSSFFGSILRGESNLSLENLIKIANFLKISPLRINPEYRSSDVASYKIYATSSGKNPPADFRYFSPGDINIWADTRVPIFTENQKKPHRLKYFSKGLTFMCSTQDFPDLDENFLNSNTPYWLILRPEKETICITSREKPSFRDAKVLRIVGLHMI
jgi:transcriptional regulator with XRE-family HTH domain